MKLWTWFLRLLYPPKCVFCGKLLRDEETDLCAACRADLPKCTGCIERGEKCYAAYYYEGAVKDSIRRFKFGGQQQFAEAYARIMAMLILREGIEFDIMSWVPISKERRKKRGYCQTELIAKAVGKELGIVPLQTLIKTKDNRAQSSLHGQKSREDNVKGVYAAFETDRFQKQKVLLIDDVITSGATLNECARTLRKAGAKSVVCLTLAAVRK